MNNEQPIDLSKAYAGQIAHLSNGQTLEINRIGKTESLIVIWDFFGLEYKFNYCGKCMGKTENFNADIVSLSDPIQVQAARIEGEIKGLESIIGMLHEFYTGQVGLKIVALKTQLKALTNEGNN